MTYGELRGFLKQWAPDAPIPLLDGWIQGRYTQILDRLDWDRLQGQIVLPVAAEYATGTVTVTPGSLNVTGAGTTWTAAMTGRLFRIGVEEAWYSFTYVSATSGTLDRAYQGTGGAGLSYRINQNLVALPAECRILEQVRLLSPGRDLPPLPISEVNEQYPSRNLYGEPLHHVRHMDTASALPVMQVELLPIPTAESSVGVWYVYDPASPSSTATTLLPWVRPRALQAGVQGDICAWRKDWSGMDRFEAQFERHMTDMVRTAALNRGPTPLRCADWITRHERNRYDR